MRTPSRPLMALLIALSLTACKRESATEGDKNHPSGDDGPGSGPGTATPSGSVESTDILARTETVSKADVKHVLIGWKDLAAAYGSRMDPRAKNRTQAEADKLAVEIADKLRKDPSQLDALVKQHSEDPGSMSGDPYTVTARSNFVPEFKKLALRLEPNEVGIVKTTYGYHVMMRLPPPPPDPLASADILSREVRTKDAHVRHVLIGWKDVPAAGQMPVDPRAAERTKEQADAIAASVLEKVRAGEDMVALMKEYSEDPGTKDNGTTYEVTPDASLVDSFKDLSLRMDVGEAGMVTSPFGWHIIKRVEPPPPDPLESADILAREPVTEKAEVKHILLSYKDLDGKDPRAKTRTRAQLEKLVAATVAKLNKGDAIEPLMAELSEDPGSAKTGRSYTATPDAGLVGPFKALSLRLNKDEVGVVKTQFGFHIIKRVE